MIMIINGTCVPENGTDICSAPSSSAGLSVGLTLFFFLLVMIAGVVVYKYHSKIRNMVQFGQRRRSQEKGCPEAPQADPHEYTSRTREESVGQTPIYENLTTQAAGCKRPAANQSRSPGEPEEDLYVQCDLPDDCIYSNDPACNSILPNFQEEDVYLVPDSE